MVSPTLHPAFPWYFRSLNPDAGRYMDKVIETDKLILWRFQETDAEDVMEYLNSLTALAK